MATNTYSFTKQSELQACLMDFNRARIFNPFIRTFPSQNRRANLKRKKKRNEMYKMINYISAMKSGGCP